MVSSAPIAGCAPTLDGKCIVASYSGDRLYAHAMGPDGAILWPSFGFDLGPTYRYDPVRILADDAGGVFVLRWGWNGAASAPLVLNRVTGAGALAPGWPDGGLFLGSSALGAAPLPALLRLAGGDVMVLWKTGGSGFARGQFILQRVRADGAVASGWPDAGRVVRAITDLTSMPDLISDGADGCFLVWAVELPTGTSELRAMHVLGTGDIALGWSGVGLRVSAPGAIYQASYGSENGYVEPVWPAYNYRSAPDGVGGFFVCWDDGRGPAGSSVWLTHWNRNGVPDAGWTVDGRMVSDPALAGHVGGVAAAGGGSGFVAWSAPTSPSTWSAWLSAVDPDLATPVLASVVSAAARDGRVRLEWSLGGANTAIVYRSVSGGAWTRVADAAADGSGRIVYEDAAVVPGTRYGYRLGITEGGVETFAGEAWVEVPRLALALEGARPNPSPGRALVAAFTLADASPARLDALDLAGRRVAVAEVGALGPGRHVLTLARAMPPGIYMLRLTQAGHDLRARAAVLP